MSFIHPFSDECTTSQLDLFKIPSTVTAVEEFRWFHYKPAAALTSSHGIDFRVAGTEEFIDLSNIFLEVEVQILKSDGSPLPTKAAESTAPPNLFDAILPSNNFASCLFQQVDLFLNNVLVTSATNMYPYRSYLDNLFYQSGSAKKTYMYSGMWQQDEDKRKERIKRVYQGKTLKLYFPLHLDLVQQERVLLNLVDMNVRLNLSDQTLCYSITNTTGDRPKHSIINATLHVKKLKLFPDCEAAILKALGETSVKYFYTNTQMRHRVVDSGSSTFFCDNLFPGTLPRRFVVGLVPMKAFNGSWDTDPFKFTSNGVVEVRAFVDSIQTPVPSLELDTEDDDFARAYTLLFDNMYALHPATTLSITPEDFKSHCTFFAWTLSTENDLENSDTIGLIKRGHVRLDFRFKEALKTQLACIIYAHFPQVVQIDANREVIIESV